MLIAVDFDGTIVEHKFPDIGNEISGATEVLKRLQNKGHKIILWTCREGDPLQEAVKWLNDKDFYPDAVNENIDKSLSFGKRKVVASIYIDDRSIYAPAPIDWYEICLKIIQEC